MKLQKSARALSLTGRLFRGLVIPTAALALLLGLGGAWAIHGIVEAVNDRLLGASARAIAETLSVEAGEITLDLPPWALGMLENSARDNIYYNIHHGERLITGYPNLPPPRGTQFAPNTQFRYGHYRDQRVRIAWEVRRLPRIQHPVVVQVAETLEARHALRRSMLMRLILLEVALLVLASLLVPVGVRWGLGPLTRLRHAIDTRRAADFTPLPLQHVPHELRDLVETFNLLLARLENAAEATRRFTADASHQMRTPLSILRTHIGLLKSATMDDQRSVESIADIEAAADRLQRLLVQLLALARAESADSAGINLRAVDIAATARAVAEEYALASSRAGVDLHFVITDSEPFLARGDELLVRELLSNLMDNAIRYNKPGGAVTVRITREQHAVSVEVEDDGPSIPPAEREKVFTRFYRLARDQSRAGSGLGLSIVRAIAQMLAAEVILANGRGGKGLCVRIVFPVPRGVL